jgi:hypothetical protein
MSEVLSRIVETGRSARPNSTCDAVSSATWSARPGAVTVTALKISASSSTIVIREYGYSPPR